MDENFYEDDLPLSDEEMLSQAQSQGETTLQNGTNRFVDDLNFAVLVYDKKTGNVDAVTNVDEKKIDVSEAEKSNTKLLIFEGVNDNAFKAFVANFKNQYNNPTEFGVYRLAAKGVHRIKEVVSTLKEVDFSKMRGLRDIVRYMSYKEMGISTLRQLNEKDIAKLDEELKNRGFDLDSFKKTSDYSDLLNFKKTGLLPLKVDGEDVGMARLAVRTDMETGELKLASYSILKHAPVNEVYKGQTFSEEDKQNLLHSGNLGRVFEYQAKNGTVYPMYVSVDPLTNQLTACNTNSVEIPRIIAGKTLSQEEFDALKEGKAVEVKGLQSNKNSKLYDVVLQVNAEKKGIEFIFEPGLSYSQRLEKENNKSFQSIKELPGVNLYKGEYFCHAKLSKEQIETLSKGKSVYLTNMSSSKGESFNSYIHYDPVNKKIAFGLTPEEKRERELRQQNKIKEKQAQNNSAKNKLS